MNQISPEEIWNLNEIEFLTLLDECFLNSKNREIHFYAPSFMYYKAKHFCSSTTDFPTISVTGNACSLNCKHCGGKVLETMHPAATPAALFKMGAKLEQDGAKGLLVSGGCLLDGSVPLENFVMALKQIKHELDLKLFVHTGIIDMQNAMALKEAGVDAALIDVIASPATIENIYNLNISVQDYANSLKALENAEIPFVPHVIVGLNYGSLDGELQALKMISQVNPSALVIIAFMPIRGTEMAKVPPPKPFEIAKVVLLARLMFPKIPIVLGCMRPKGKSRNETDVLALKAGVDGIAFPSEAAINFTKKMDSKIVFSSFCCAQMYIDALKK